jgi:hypothetical protein
MAFAAILASVADEQVGAFRERRIALLDASMLVQCSHLLTSWVRPDDLRKILRQAIDGGQNLRADLWHPLRSPIWHDSASVIGIEQAFCKVWADNLERSGQPDPSNWYVVEVAKALSAFQHAVDAHEGIVSFLNEPWDEERARRVRIPLASRPKRLPVPEQFRNRR